MTLFRSHVGTAHRFGQGAQVRVGGMRRLPLVHAFGAAFVDHPLAVAEDDVAGRQAHALEQVDAGDGRRAGTVDDDRSEEHTSELQSLMRTPYAVFRSTQKQTYICN